MAIAEQQPRLPELHRGTARRGAGRRERACRQVGSAHDDRDAGRAADLAARLRDRRLALARPVVLRQRRCRDRRHGRHARRARRAVPPLDPVAEPVRRRGVRVPGSRRAGAPALVVLDVAAALRARLPPVAAAVAGRASASSAASSTSGSQWAVWVFDTVGGWFGFQPGSSLEEALSSLFSNPTQGVQMVVQLLLLFFINFAIFLGPADGDGHRADPVVRARRRDVGREARRRPRPGRAEGGDPPRRHALAVGRAVRAGRRQARARPAVPGRARHRQDDAGEGDRDGLQLPVRDDPGLRLRADLHRHGRGHRPVPGAQGQAARAQVGRPVHRLHRRDRRRRHAPPEPRHRPAGSLRPRRQRGRERRRCPSRPSRSTAPTARISSSGDLVLETAAWRDRLFAEREPGRARAPQRHRERSCPACSAGRAAAWR